MIATLPPAPPGGDADRAEERELLAGQPLSPSPLAESVPPEAPEGAPPTPRVPSPGEVPVLVPDLLTVALSLRPPVGPSPAPLSLAALWRAGATPPVTPGSALGLWRGLDEDPEEVAPAEQVSTHAAAPAPASAHLGSEREANRGLVDGAGLAATTPPPAPAPAGPEPAAVIALAERRPVVPDTVYDNRDTVPAIRRSMDKMIDLLCRSENIYIGYLQGLRESHEVIVEEQFRSLGKEGVAKIMPNGRATEECASIFLAVEAAKRTSKKRKEGHTMEDVLHAADGVPNAFYYEVIEKGQSDAERDARLGTGIRHLPHLPTRRQVEETLRDLRGTYAWARFPDAYLRNLYCKGYLRGFSEKRGVVGSPLRATASDTYVPFAPLSTTFLIAQRLLIEMSSIPRIGQAEAIYLLARYGKLVDLHMPLFIETREDYNLPKIFDFPTCRMIRQSHAEMEGLIAKRPTKV